MSTNTALTEGGGSGQSIAAYRSQRSPERPCGKSKRTLIESACTACQRRKSRCDGHRPACSRCQSLHTECEYNAEEGESRWSALRRKNHTLEKERDEARELLILIESQPEPEALEIYRRIRKGTHGDDLGALVHEIREFITASPSLQQQHYRQEQPCPPKPSPHHHQQQPHKSYQQQQSQHNQQQEQQQQESFPSGASAHLPTGSATQLPPLRSVVQMPVADAGAGEGAMQ